MQMQGTTFTTILPPQNGGISENIVMISFLFFSFSPPFISTMNTAKRTNHLKEKFNKIIK
jgi:hypothetical protein